MGDKKKYLKIITLGDSGVGKTAIHNNFVNGKFEKYRCSIAPEFYTKALFIENEHVYVHVWDTYGQERFNALGPPFYRGTNCYTLCFDIHNEESFVNLEKWIEEVRIHLLGNIPFVLLGTKKDITRTDKSISKERIEQWCKKMENQGIIDKVHYFETSAKLSENITEAYNVALKLAFENYNKTENDQKSNNFIIGPPEETKVETCC
ncbi:hypothetical protein ACTFIU_002211 [Dictyostelium citrinum]